MYILLSSLKKTSYAFFFLNSRFGLDPRSNVVPSTFDWLHTRNMSVYLRPNENTTLMQPQMVGMYHQQLMTTGQDNLMQSSETSVADSLISTHFSDNNDKSVISYCQAPSIKSQFVCLENSANVNPLSDKRSLLSDISSSSSSVSAVLLSLLTVVFSAPGNFGRRKVIRETWGDEHQGNIEGNNNHPRFLLSLFFFQSYLGH